MRIYFAAPLFTSAETAFNKKLAYCLRDLGHEVFLPQEHEQNIAALNSIFKSDVGGVDWSQLILGNIDGADSDSGTCWELGYAYAKNKPVIVYRTDIRQGRDDIVNLMVTESANVVLLMPLATPEQLADRINKEIRERWDAIGWSQNAGPLVGDGPGATRP